MQYISQINETMICISTMVIRVVELSSFQAGGTKLQRFLPKNQHTQGKLLNLRIGVVGRWCQKVPKFDFQSQFSMSKIIGIFLIFFSLKIPI